MARAWFALAIVALLVVSCFALAIGFYETHMTYLHAADVFGCIAVIAGAIVLLLVLIALEAWANS